MSRQSILSFNLGGFGNNDWSTSGRCHRRGLRRYGFELYNSPLPTRHLRVSGRKKMIRTYMAVLKMATGLLRQR